VFGATLTQRSPTRGRETELLAQTALQAALEAAAPGTFQVHTASEAVDFGYSVDLVVKQGEQLLAGVQVKPESYVLVPRHDAHGWHAAKSAAFPVKVHMVYYDACDQFRGLEEVVAAAEAACTA